MTDFKFHCAVVTCACGGLGQALVGLNLNALATLLASRPVPVPVVSL